MRRENRKYLIYCQILHFRYTYYNNVKNKYINNFDIIVLKSVSEDIK